MMVTLIIQVLASQLRKLDTPVILAIYSNHQITTLTSHLPNYESGPMNLKLIQILSNRLFHPENCKLLHPYQRSLQELITTVRWLHGGRQLSWN